LEFSRGRASIAGNLLDISDACALKKNLFFFLYTPTLVGVAESVALGRRLAAPYTAYVLHPSNRILLQCWFATEYFDGRLFIQK
jgi:hypothetical protein